MKLSKENHSKITEHIAKKWSSPAVCQVCKSNSWTVSQEVLELREFHGGSMVLGNNSAIYPIVPITCGSCGNTVLFNPLVAGLDLSKEANDGK